MSAKQPANDTAIEDLKAFGASDEEIEKLTATKDEDFKLWEENQETFQLFLLCSTQWRTAGMAGQILGFDYAAIKIVCETYEIALTKDLLANLQVMEIAAVQHFSEKASQ